ncbi:hypothetical protein [Streptomyces sp. NBRC 110035]|uniref:hypothetical protein n=1 Tax=Streptomyces sp. NBRC 110035 TaxID=1547867 RepID=UPI0005A9ED35|nr:hypothetical protein [Streptomyces sp. NBRC 110035]
MNRIDIAHQVSTTLGDHADDFNIDGIVDDLIAAHDGNLASIDDFDSQSYWAIVETHDVSTQADEDNDLGTTAWLAVQSNVLVYGEGPQVMVLAHQADGNALEVMPSTALPVPLSDDHDIAQDAAETTLKAAGWETVGEWNAVDTGYTVKVRRA